MTTRRSRTSPTTSPCGTRPTAIPAGGGSIYIDDFSAGGTVVKSYHVLDDLFVDGTSVDISSGAGETGPVSGREILRNTFDLGGNGFNAISFNGSGGVAWFVNPVGGAVIKLNSFSDSTQYIRARGVYDNTQFDWKSYWNDNTYDKAAVDLSNEATFAVRPYAYDVFTNVRRIGGTIQGEIQDGAISHAQPGDTVLVKPGTYPEHVVVDRALTLKGANAGIAGNAARGAESVITGDSTGALQLTANNVTVNGFKIASPSNALGAGIHMSAATSGALITDNLVTGNQIGIYANSAGASTISFNLFDANNQPGSSGGSGIYSEYTNHLTVDHNEFRNHTTNNPIIFGATAAGVHHEPDGLEQLPPRQRQRDLRPRGQRRRVHRQRHQRVRRHGTQPRWRRERARPGHREHAARQRPWGPPPGLRVRPRERQRHPRQSQRDRRQHPVWRGQHERLHRDARRDLQLVRRGLGADESGQPGWHRRHRRRPRARRPSCPG